MATLARTLEAMAAVSADRIAWHAADLRQPAEIESLADAARHWRCNVVVHNAGVASFGRFDAMRAAEMAEVMQINLLAPMQLTHALLPLLTALRELREEAGLDDLEAADLAWVGGVRTQRLEPQGWHDEQLLVYNLQVPEGSLPVNRDGEVQAFARLSPHEVVTRMQAGEFTPDACASLARGLGVMMTGAQRQNES